MTYKTTYRNCPWQRESTIDDYIHICVGRRELRCICEQSIIDGTCIAGIKETDGMTRL